MRALVVGDPSFFRIRSGSNPHTRNRWGVKKCVDLDLAKRQWKNFVDRLEEMGARVYVIPPVKDCPGMVFPANAGVVIPREEKIPFSKKTFLLSSLIEGRKSETNYDEPFFRQLGFQIEKISCPFEGEADFFQAGSYFIFTYGKILPQHFRMKRGWPPYERVYGFRSSLNFLETVTKWISRERILPLELADERFYHGDTVFCPFGEGYDHVLAYLPALTSQAQGLLKEHLVDRLILLSDEDAFKYAANSFYLSTEKGKFLIMPSGVSPQLRDQVIERGVTPIEINVSEFFEKGGGSVKCMILDLGPMG
ncbi:MAG: hypothetical protein HYS08_03590 [Chlamydiae bacterium]|nr:hypothetical protein [Chlamydiota bacterium]MBI3266788.1 hypothetical protein [Chlamydiota bacterium]